jgi:hypothetical protein
VGKENILNRLEENWQVLLQAVSGLSEKELMEAGVCGDWSVRDIMCHISTWEEEAMENIPFILRGESTPRYSSHGGIVEFNARAQADKKEYTLTRVKREFHSTHQRFTSYLDSIQAVFFNVNPRLIKRIRLDGYNHYLEHAAQIEKWRTAQNPR